MISENCLKVLDDKKFVSCSRDFSIKLWDIDKEKSLRSIKNDCWNFCMCHLKNFNNNFIRVGDEKKNIKIWNVNNGKLIKLIQNEHENNICRLIHISQVEPFNLMLSTSNSSIKLWNLNKFTLLREYNEHKGWINAITYMKDDLFCTRGEDHSIKIWKFSESKR